MYADATGEPGASKSGKVSRERAKEESERERDERKLSERSFSCISLLPSWS